MAVYVKDYLEDLLKQWNILVDSAVRKSDFNKKKKKFQSVFRETLYVLGGNTAFVAENGESIFREYDLCTLIRIRDELYRYYHELCLE